MKRVFFLSGLVLTQTLLASTLTIYNSGIALVHENIHFEITKNDKQFNYNNIPDTLIEDSVDINFPTDVTLNSEVYKNKKFLPRELKKKSHLTSSLLFNIQSTKNYNTTIDLNYLMSHIRFHSDYQLHIEKERADLTAWVDITNDSGKDFNNVSVNLIAGEPHKTHNYLRSISYKSDMPVMHKSNIADINIAGYHKYSLPSPITLKSYEKTRIKLFEYKNISIQNSYIADMNNPLYLMGERSSSVTREVAIKGLSKELPAGLVRIYTGDADQKILLGEDRVQNSPKESAIKLKIGKDFDTKVSQKVLSRNDSKEMFNVDVTYTLSNHSNEDKIITLHIPFNKKESSKVISKQKYSFTKGNLVTFTLKVKANSKRSFHAEFISKRR
jgi:hypothetical protein